MGSTGGRQKEADLECRGGVEGIWEWDELIAYKPKYPYTVTAVAAGSYGGPRRIRVQAAVTETSIFNIDGLCKTT